MRDESRHYRVGYAVFDVGNNDVSGLACSAIGEAAPGRDTSGNVHSNDALPNIGIAVEDSQLPFRDASVPEPRHLFRLHHTSGDGLYVYVLAVPVLSGEFLGVLFGATH